MKYLRPFKSQQRGFTLIQVMAILGVLGIVITLATSAYLKHQSKHYIKEALEEAAKARTVVAKNVSNDVETSSANSTIASTATNSAPKDWSKGYEPKDGENHSWSVYVDPSSAAVVVSLWSFKQPATLLWVPLKNAQSNDKDASQALQGKLITEGGVTWICVVKDDAIPDTSKLFAPLSANVPRPAISDELVSADCQ